MGGKAPPVDQQRHGPPPDQNGNTPYQPPAPPPNHVRGSEVQSVDTPVDTRSDAQKMADFKASDPAGYQRELDRQKRDGAIGKGIETGATIIGGAINPLLGAGIGALSAGAEASSTADAAKRESTIESTGATMPSGVGGPNDVTTAIDKQTGLNRPDQTNSWGSTTWKDGKQITSLTPGLESTNLSLQEQARLNALRGVGTGDDARNQAITGAYNQATSRLNPQWAQRDEHLSSALANQGLDPNSQAYRNAMLQQSQQRNDAYSSAMNGAIAQGTAAGHMAFSDNMSAQRLPYEQMGDLYNLEHPFGFNAAASPNVLGQNQLNADQANLKRRLDADTTAAQYGMGTKMVAAGVEFIKTANGWMPTGNDSVGGDGGSASTGHPSYDTIDEAFNNG